MCHLVFRAGELVGGNMSSYIYMTMIYTRTYKSISIWHTILTVNLLSLLAPEDFKIIWRLQPFYFECRFSFVCFIFLSSKCYDFFHWSVFCIFLQWSVLIFVQWSWVFFSDRFHYIIQSKVVLTPPPPLP